MYNSVNFRPNVFENGSYFLKSAYQGPHRIYSQSVELLYYSVNVFTKMKRLLMYTIHKKILHNSDKLNFLSQAAEETVK